VTAGDSPEGGRGRSRGREVRAGERAVEPRQHHLVRVADEVLAEDGQRDRLRHGGRATPDRVTRPSGGSAAAFPAKGRLYS
jgi:hypothetical protein